MATLPNQEQAMQWTPEEAKTIVAFAQKIAGLGIKAQFIKLEPGPVINGYYFSLDHSQPIAKIFNKEEDFALAANVEKVTIERIGGQVVIFVPNKERQVIKFQDALYWLAQTDKASKQSLPILLGVDHLGIKVSVDLAEMPHILIAGATGSGKSVLETAILCTLAVLRAPREMHVYLVDTKRVDLTLFENLDHVKRIVRDLSDFHNMMQTIMSETRRRMTILEYHKVRNIREYNASVQNDLQKLPYIVIVVDELADLIEQDRARYRTLEKDEKKDYVTIEKWLQLLIQICRAAGVHIIAATQRPSVKIISGDIKANFPCRISLRLSTDADSRTILGEGGAQNLLGKGDMLVQLPEAESLRRYHGPFVDLNDIKHIIDQHESLRIMFDTLKG
jgi:DNA segregation ATPase FtsK/SpoIIIE, S-DNA-T family